MKSLLLVREFREKLTQTGAITTVDVGELKRNPSSSIVNALAGGNIPGIMARQTSGQLGKNISEFWIRGISNVWCQLICLCIS
ncbi:hypothetical protein NXW65_24130 [Bacteroides thetaiotaomicron]|uniref:hypothetical protein n=1 Tax=Bacteroides thetaiotaomicron TaxID=818 RepID=UPI002164FD83|nr:hypothetical protein [Bacteroides thetaiotaomicron]MCS3044265.1 hypothetical protein [Bacteroides thetaiotaomicron]